MLFTISHFSVEPNGVWMSRSKSDIESGNRLRGSHEFVMRARLYLRRYA